MRASRVSKFLAAYFEIVDRFVSSVLTLEGRPSVTTELQFVRESCKLIELTFCDGFMCGFDICLKMFRWSAPPCELLVFEMLL